MTNFLYVSPAFPETNVAFVQHLAAAGVRVVGVGDRAEAELPWELRDVLSDYRQAWLPDYDAVRWAVGELEGRHGRIDWVESNNEYWLGLDARLRTDLGMTTGVTSDMIPSIRSKARMKEVFHRATIPTARQAAASDDDTLRSFVAEVGFPVIVKPEWGVGATSTHRLNDIVDLEHFLGEWRDSPVVMEEYVVGDIVSYDGIVNAHGVPVFEAASEFPPSIADIVLTGSDLAYRVLAEIPPALREIGRRTLAAFGVTNRFFHLEFFRLAADRPGLGAAGNFVALEVNMRPAGGYTVDMYNIARDGDVFQIYTDLVTGHDTGAAERAARAPAICAYASRRDWATYELSGEEIWWRYGSDIRGHRRNPGMFVPQMGDEFFLLRTTDEARADAFTADVLRRA